jgi:hypothetical protein
MTDEITVKEVSASDDHLLISSNIDVDCVQIRKAQIPELISKLREYNDD